MAVVVVVVAVVVVVVAVAAAAVKVPKRSSGSDRRRYQDARFWKSAIPEPQDSKHAKNSHAKVESLPDRSNLLRVRHYGFFILGATGGAQGLG